MEAGKLTQDEAVGVVAASARRLFPIVSEQQARDLATLILNEPELWIRGEGIPKEPRL